MTPNEAVALLDEIDRLAKEGYVVEISPDATKPNPHDGNSVEPLQVRFTFADPLGWHGFGGTSAWEWERDTPEDTAASLLRTAIREFRADPGAADLARRRMEER